MHNSGRMKLRTIRKEQAATSGEIIQLNEGVIWSELKELARGSEEETLNELPDAETGNWKVAPHTSSIVAPSCAARMTTQVAPRAPAPALCGRGATPFRAPARCSAAARAAASRARGRCGTGCRGWASFRRARSAPDAICTCQRGR